MNPRRSATIGLVARILIVDDNLDVAKLFGILFEHCGYEVDVVTDAGHCLLRVASFKPDVVLLDIAMPNISGYDRARKIRTEWEFDNVIIIATSGYGGPERAQLSLEAGCDQHLAKPVSQATLETGIAEALEKRLRSKLIACAH